VSQESGPNIGHSVFQRLKNQAREHADDLTLLLERYAVERFLYRLAQSKQRDPSCQERCRLPYL